MREIAKQFKDLPEEDIEYVLRTKYNEQRSVALCIMVEQFWKAKKDEKKRKSLYDLYMKNLEHVNNWNLVDVSAF